MASPGEAATVWYWSDYDTGAIREVRPAPPPVRRIKRVRPAATALPARPDARPQGPIVIAVSIDRQSLKVYDANGVFAESPVSTGMRGHATPTGVFSIIQKNKWHRSNIYSGAPMPYMQRITWSGIALHAGALPGYPASHGCIRMPMSFATRLWGWTRMGARVVIAPGEIAPSEITHAMLPSQKLVPVADVAPAQQPERVASADRSELALRGLRHAAAPAETKSDAAAEAVDSAASASADAKLPDTGHAQEKRPVTEVLVPEGPPAPPLATPKRNAHLAAFISRKDSRLYVRQDFKPLFDVAVTIKDDRPLGTHVFTGRNDGAIAGALRWSALSMPLPRRAEPRIDTHRRSAAPAAEPASQTPGAFEALERIALPPDAASRLADVLGMGGSLVVSDLGIHAGETGEGTDFIVPLRTVP